RDRILLRGRGELIDETLDHPRIVGNSNSAPEAVVEHWLLVAHVFNPDRGDVVEQLLRSIHRIRVDAVFEHRRRETRKNRWTDDPVRPRDRLTARVERCP